MDHWSMIVHMGKTPDSVTLSIYGEWPSGSSISSHQTIGPGWKMFGKTYEEWRHLEPGEHEIPDDVNGDDDYGPAETAEPA